MVISVTSGGKVRTSYPVAFGRWPEKPFHVSRFSFHVRKNRSFVARPPSPAEKAGSRFTFLVSRLEKPVVRRPSPVPCPPPEKPFHIPCSSFHAGKPRFTPPVSRLPPEGPFHVPRRKTPVNGRWTQMQRMGDDDRARKRPVRAGSEKRAPPASDQATFRCCLAI